MIDPNKLPAPLVHRPESSELILRMHQVGLGASIRVPAWEHFQDHFPSTRQHPATFIGGLSARLIDDPHDLMPLDPQRHRRYPWCSLL
jgi:hypothetical protein